MRLLQQAGRFALSDSLVVFLLCFNLPFNNTLYDLFVI
jgi:hypothetical protein